MMTYP